MKPLQKQLIFTYTTEDLFLLQEIYLNTLDNYNVDEWYDTYKNISSEGVKGFVNWLMAEDRTKLL